GFSKPQIETQQRGFFVTVLSGQRARQCLAPIRVGGSDVGLGLLARDDAFWRHQPGGSPARAATGQSLVAQGGHGVHGHGAAGGQVGGGKRHDDYYRHAGGQGSGVGGADAVEQGENQAGGRERRRQADRNAYGNQRQGLAQHKSHHIHRAGPKGHAHAN